MALSLDNDKDARKTYYFCPHCDLDGTGYGKHSKSCPVGNFFRVAKEIEEAIEILWPAWEYCKRCIGAFKTGWERSLGKAQDRKETDD